MHTIGIPRALYYYRYFPFWQKFWESLDCQIVLSRKTSKQIVDWGVSLAVDGTCLPVKVYYGHIYDLVQKQVDMIFIPKFISIDKGEYICPKFMGLPDMMRKHIPSTMKILSPEIDARRGGHQVFQAYWRLGREFASWPKVLQAYRNGLQAQHDMEKKLREGHLLPRLLEMEQVEQVDQGRLTIAVLGHEYLVYDKYISMDVIGRLLEAGVRVLTTDIVPKEAIQAYSRKFPKKMYWTAGHRILGSMGYMMEHADGIISVVAFACGTDSIVSDLVTRIAQRSRVPHLQLSLDEHTGEAGAITRIEAFIDMLERRKKLETNRAAHG